MNEDKEVICFSCNRVIWDHAKDCKVRSQVATRAERNVEAEITKENMETLEMKKLEKDLYEEFPYLKELKNSTEMLLMYVGNLKHSMILTMDKHTLNGGVRIKKGARITALEYFNLLGYGEGTDKAIPKDIKQVYYGTTILEAPQSRLDKIDVYRFENMQFTFMYRKDKWEGCGHTGKNSKHLLFSISGIDYVKSKNDKETVIEKFNNAKGKER